MLLFTFGSQAPASSTGSPPKKASNPFVDFMEPAAKAAAPPPASTKSSAPSSVPRTVPEDESIVLSDDDSDDELDEDEEEESGVEVTAQPDNDPMAAHKWF